MEGRACVSTAHQVPGHPDTASLRSLFPDDKIWGTWESLNMQINGQTFLYNGYPGVRASVGPGRGRRLGPGLPAAPL